MKVRPLLFSLAAACCLLCAPLLTKAAVLFDDYVILTPGEDYLLPPDGIVSDVCVSDGSVLSASFDEAYVSLCAQEPGVSSILVESESAEGTVYDLRTVVVTAGGTYCWPAPAYSSSRDMSITRGYGVDDHKGIDIAYASRDVLESTPVYSFAEGRIVKIVHNDKNTYGSWSASDSYNKYNYDRAETYDPYPDIIESEKGTGAYLKGNTVIIEHEIDGEVIYSEYMHLQAGSLDFAIAAMKAGVTLPAGTPIGIMGNTGQSRGSTGVHLHFMLTRGAMDSLGLCKGFNPKSVLGKDFQAGVTSISGSIFDNVPGFGNDDVLELLRGNL